VGRKLWSGLIVAGVNSVLLCVIGMRTAQFGFIPANLFCIAVYLVSLRSWIREGGEKSAAPARNLESGHRHSSEKGEAHRPTPARPRTIQL
jgi:hypothetical protein